MSQDNWQKYLTAIKACDAGLAWANQLSGLQESVDKCADGAHLIWFFSTEAVDSQEKKLALLKSLVDYVGKTYDSQPAPTVHSIADSYSDIRAAMLAYLSNPDDASMSTLLMEGSALRQMCTGGMVRNKTMTPTEKTVLHLLLALAVGSLATQEVLATRYSTATTQAWMQVIAARYELGLMPSTDPAATTAMIKDALAGYLGKYLPAIIAARGVLRNPGAHQGAG